MRVSYMTSISEFPRINKRTTNFYLCRKVFKDQFLFGGREGEAIIIKSQFYLLCKKKKRYHLCNILFIVLERADIEMPKKIHGMHLLI